MLTNEKENAVFRGRLKYRFRDLDCRFCAEYMTCPAFCLCPYIIDALKDLRADSEFESAIMAADLCTTPQRLTLIYIREGRL
jgi:hypothetical protein